MTVAFDFPGGPVSPFMPRSPLIPGKPCLPGGPTSPSPPLYQHKKTNSYIKRPYIDNETTGCETRKGIFQHKHTLWSESTGNSDILLRGRF